MTEPVYPLLKTIRHRIGIDGAGITSLIAGAGCPLSCRWCINKKLLSEASPQPVTAQQLYETVRIDDLYFQATSGGVTFGGGEPLLHADFIRHFKQIIPPVWKLNVETSLAVPAENLKIVCDAIDCFIVDCKDMNPEIYHNYTGGNSSLLKDNLQHLAQAVGPEKVLVRIPLIPEYNNPEDQQKSIKTLQAMGFTRFDVFNYTNKK